MTELLLSLTAGIGLAAATGFRVFLPLLVAALAARWGGLPLTEHFQWLASMPALVTLLTASLLEIGAYYIPIVDHALDIMAAPAAMVAGVVASAATMTEMPPEVMWPVAVVGGGGIAGVTKVMSGLVRAKSGLATAGLANPVVSTGETLGSVLLSVLAVVVPVLATIVLVAVGVWLVRYSARRLFPESV